MIKADIHFKENLTNIITSLYKDDNPRPKYLDGVPAHCFSIKQVFEKYDLSRGEFPITTLRNTAIKTGIKEVLWIYQKQDNLLSTARELGINWWDEWDIGDGTIGNRYGYTVNKWGLIDKLLTNLKNDPFSRRHIMNMYQEHDLNSSNGLYPCAYETLWTVRRVNNDLYLDMLLVQRSSDYIMANYINKTQYVALMMMVASHCGYLVGTFAHLVNDLHIYDRHMDAAKEIVYKKPLDIQPIIKLKENKSFYDFTVDDFIIENISDITKIKSKLEIAI